MSDEQRDWKRGEPSADYQVSIFADGQEIQGWVIDISHSGVYINTEHLLPVGTKIQVDFSAADRGVQGRGEVTRHAREGEPRGMGVVFSGIPLQERMSLDKLIERIKGNS